MGILQFYRELFRLLRGVPQNALITHHLPWKRGWVRGLFFWGQVAIAVCWTGIGIWKMATLPEDATFDNWALAWAISSWQVLVFLGGMILMPASVILFGIPMTRNCEGLTELHQTTQGQRAVALADVFWGIVVGSIVPMAGMLQAVPLVFSNSVKLFLQNQSFSTAGMGLFGFFMFFFFSAIIPAFMAICIFWRFRMRMMQWPLLILVPATTLAMCLWYFALKIPLDRLRWEFALFDSSDFNHFLDGLLGMVMVLVLIHVAGKLAPTRVFASIFPDQLVEKSYFAFWRSVSGDPEMKQSSRNRIRSALKGSMLLEMIGGIAIIALTFIANRFRDSEFWTFQEPDWLLGIAGVQFLFGDLLVRRICLKREELLVPGRIYESILAPMRRMNWILCIGMPALTAYCYIVYSRDTFLETDYYMMPLRATGLVLFMTFVVTPGWMAWILAHRRPGIVVGIVALFVLVEIFLAFTLCQKPTKDLFEPSSTYLLYPLLYLILLSPYAWLTSFQKVHERCHSRRGTSRPEETLTAVGGSPVA